MAERKEGYKGNTDPGRVYTALRKGWRCEKIGGNEGEPIGDAARREMVVEHFNVVHEGNMEDPRWMSEILAGQSRSNRQQGQGTRWG